MHGQGRGQAAIYAHPGRAVQIQGIEQMSEFACSAVVNYASKKSIMHDMVIEVALVKEEKAGKLTPLNEWVFCGIENKDSISGHPPMPRTVLVIMQHNIPAHPLLQAERQIEGQEPE
jgi:hypothetical protein